eukprot:jgi/Chlat1/3418/Chrsp23S03748
MAQDDAARRRLGALQGHLRAVSDAAAEGVRAEIAAAAAAGELQAKEFYIDSGYSAILPEKLSDSDSWKVHRSAQSPLKLLDRFPDADSVETLYDNFEQSVQKHANRPCLGTRQIGQDGTAGAYKWMTYGEAGEQRTACGSGFMQHGIRPGGKVGLYLQNCAEWVLAEQACNAYSMVSVPLYDTLGPDVVKYICNHAELSAVICSPDKVAGLLAALHDCPSVKLVVVTGAADAAPRVTVPAGCAVVSWARLLQAGRTVRHPHVPPRGSEVATICYTSGTTGVPKGAVLSHANIIANAGGYYVGTTCTSTDVHISYLPLAHIYERVTMVLGIHCGTAVGFFQGDIMKLMDDIQELKPTIFISVPRLWNRIYDKIMATVNASGGMRKRLFHAAYNAKRNAILQGRQASPVWDRLVFNKMRQALGGRVRYLGTGASPISAEVFDFMRVCFGARVVEGYGMTETSCVISMTQEGDTSSGHVGPPIPCIEVKLEDVPEMDYRHSDKPYPRGEICVRGPSIFQGYYKDEAQTREVVDPEGWLHTGDVGLWLPQGQLKIIDRKKNIFKLAQGEYIAPEKIENAYVRSPLVSQVFVHGDSLTSFLVAVVIPDPDALALWAKENGYKDNTNMARLCADPKVEAAIIASLKQAAAQAQLRGFEQVKAIRVVPEPFSVENGLLTPSFKIKRPQAAAVFADAIAELYARVKANGEDANSL